MKTTLLLVLGVLPILVIGQKSTPRTFDPNFAHAVYFWLNNPDSEEDRLKFETSLNTFLSNSRYAKTNFVGIPPKATREVVDDSFTYNLIVTFESAEAQQMYQEEAAHLLFIEECKALWKKVVVYDAIPNNP